jgi:hypothetical protein
MRNVFRGIAGVLCVLAAVGCAAEGGEDQPSSVGVPVEDPSYTPRVDKDAFPPGARIVRSLDELSFAGAQDLAQSQSSQKERPVTCWEGSYALLSAHEGLYATVDLGQSNVLRAQGAHMQEWEELKICGAFTWPPYGAAAGVWAWGLSFWSVAASKYVTVALDYSGSSYAQLIARADVRAEWEKLTLFPQRYGASIWSYTIRSEANALFVSAEFAYRGSASGMLRARANEIYEWEYWQVVPYPGTAPLRDPRG